jgi:hypothetical protein
MRRFFHFGFLTLFLLPFLSSIIQAQLEHFGLPGERINAVAIVPTNFWPPPPRLAAATDSNGVFLRDLSSPDSQWTYFGLSGKNIKSLYTQHWGAGPLEAHQLFAGVRPNNMLGDSTFLYQNRFLTDTTWTSADSGLDTSIINQIKAISAVHYFGHMSPGPVFISAGGKVYRSYEPGTWPWEDIWPQPGPAIINVIEIYPPGEIFVGDEIVWIGGETNIFWPFLAKSTDYGNNWEFYYPNLSGDNACDAIAIVANYPDTVYAGMEGAVIKTTDGGQNWEITALQNTPYYFYGIVANPADPDHVIAGGVSNTWQTALYETHDGGDTWQDLQPPAGTFGNGVYRYITPLVGINDPPAPDVVESFQLFQNYPNPFNPLTNLGFRIADLGFVSLEIFDVTGRKTATLVSKELPPGEYEVKWDGRDDLGKEVGSGMYILTMKKGTQIQSRKMLLIR